MLTRNFAIAAIFCITLLAQPARSQDAQKIVDQYIKAAGGSKALSKAATVIIEGTFHTSDGKNGTYTLNTKASQSLLLRTGHWRRQLDRSLQRKVRLASYRER